MEDSESYKDKEVIVKEVKKMLVQVHLHTDTKLLCTST
jgi:hypothetical protein